MKLIHLCVSLACISTMAACSIKTSGGSSDPAPSPAPARSNGGGSNGVTDYGTTDGKAGGPCRPELLKDYDNSMKSCEDDLNSCQESMDAFSKKYPVVDCQSTDADGAQVRIKISSDSSSTSSSNGSGAPVGPLLPVTNGGACPADTVTDYREVVRFCTYLDESSSMDERSDCRDRADTFMDRYRDVNCVISSDGTPVSRESVENLRARSTMYDRYGYPSYSSSSSTYDYDFYGH